MVHTAIRGYMLRMGNVAPRATGSDKDKQRVQRLEPTAIANWRPVTSPNALFLRAFK